ncbi:MAG: putative signal transducing protein, partial [Limisphaerales bacterium]
EVGMENVVIFRTFDLAEAQLVRGRLVGAGFRAEVMHENSSANFDVAGGGVRVTVPQEQAEEARALIQASNNEQ